MGNRTEKDVRHKKYGTGNVVLVSDKTKVLIHSLNLRITNVSAIDVSKEIEHTQDGDQTKVNLVKSVVK